MKLRAKKSFQYGGVDYRKGSLYAAVHEEVKDKFEVVGGEKPKTPKKKKTTSK